MLLIQDSKKLNEQIYVQYHQKMLQYAKKFTINLQDAEDVTHDSFIKIFKSIHQLKNNNSLEGWMKKIVFTTFCNRSRNKMNKKDIYSDIKEYEEHLTQDSKIESNLTRKEILFEIEKLPKGYKNVFKLNVIQGYNHKEISEIYNFLESTSRSQLIKAKRKLQKNLIELR